ncbi:MAG: hypothetical protein BGO16_12065 [Nitrobacter sp. 62-23]|nr:MAG: hypothetical protein BGO16_12065 [Nitrobacter sp. 62-23]
MRRAPADLPRSGSGCGRVKSGDPDSGATKTYEAGFRVRAERRVPNDALRNDTLRNDLDGTLSTGRYARAADRAESMPGTSGGALT